METHECYKKEVERILQSRLRRNMGQTTATGSVGKNAEAASISGSKRKPSSSCTNADCDSCSRGGCAAASAASATSTRGCDESGSQPSKRRKNSSVGEDPMSHKIIEKRRRDRMNSCLAELSHLIPSHYLKKGRGRIEKTEIVEMAIKHIKHLHALPNMKPASTAASGKEAAAASETTTSEDTAASTKEGAGKSNAGDNSGWHCPQEAEAYNQGYDDCVSEAVQYLVEHEGFPASDAILVRLLGHLKQSMKQKDPNGKSAQRTTSERDNRDSMSAGCDSDYGSFKSESVASEMGILPAPVTASAAVSSEKHYQTSSRSASAGSNYEAAGGESTASTATSPIEDSSRFNRPALTSRRSVDEPGSFKFKANMRERFTQEREELENPPTSPKFASKRRRLSCDESDQMGLSMGTDAHLPRSSTRLEGLETAEGGGKKMIPIFALHPRGSHYVPMRISSDLLTSDLKFFDLDSEAPLVLHPITISVNFCGLINLAASTMSSAQPQQAHQYSQLLRPSATMTSTSQRFAHHQAAEQHYHPGPRSASVITIKEDRTDEIRS